MRDQDNEKPPKTNFARLLARLPEGSIAYQLTEARITTEISTPAEAAFKKILKKRMQELRQKYEAGADKDA